MNVQNIATKVNFYGKIIFSLIIIILIWLIVLTVYIVEEEKKTTTLYTDIGQLNEIKAATTYEQLYNYHTRNDNLSLKSYKGNYAVTYSPIGSAEFIVENQFGENITSNINIITSTKFKRKLINKSLKPPESFFGKTMA